MNILKKISYFLFLVTLNSFSQNYINVADISEYNEAIKKALPGTTIILENGIWEDVHLEAYGKGTKENPITIKAKKAGQVILTGDSSLKIYGEHVIVEGLWFKDGVPTSPTIVSFKKSSKEFANNCRFTNSAITHFNPNYHKFKSHWVALWGKNNRVDHNNFTGKTNEGTTLVVWLKGSEHTENNHSIDANFFGLRKELDKVSAETIRIGTSKYSMESSKTLVENNTFKHCNGEIEIISNKSCDNIFRNNLFLESKGSLTLRHGDNALVENNVFLGNGIQNTGGIRVSNKGHIIRNNLLIDIRGKKNRAPIVLMNGIPNSPLNGYNQVDAVDIQNNTLINCTSMEFGANKSAEKSLPPINTLFANNLIKNSNEAQILNASDDIEGIKFEKNIVETSGGFNRYLFKKVKVEWENFKKIPMPTGANKLLASDFKNDKTPTKDIMGANKSPFTVGAFNLGTTKLPKALTVKSGTGWDTKIVTPKFKGKRVTVEPGVGTLTAAIKKVTGKTLLLLRDGVYYINKEQKINANITIQGNKKTIIKSEENLEKPFKSFFKVNEQSRLELRNVTVDGEVNTIKYAIISPSKGGARLYSLFIDNCVFKNFKNDHGYIIRAYGNTLADTISIKNSSFKDSYRGINFHAKENVSGATNANTITLENSVFENIEKFALKYTKQDSEDNSKKGKLAVTNCVFSKINDNEKGNVIELKNIHFVEVKNSVFEKSRDIVSPINLSGKENVIDNCLVYSCGEIKTSKGATQKNILDKSPRWKDKKNFIPHRKSILLKENNGNETIGIL